MIILAPGVRRRHFSEADSFAGIVRLSPLTSTLLVLIGANYAVETFLGASLYGRVVLLDLGPQKEVIYLLGGSISEWLNRGEFWRPLTTLFLHGHWPHLILNGIALFTLGSLLELNRQRQQLKGLNVLAIFLVTGLFANVTSTFLLGPLVLSCGASGGICGLFGCTLILAARKQLSSWFNADRILPLRHLLFDLCLNFGLSMLPGVNRLGHLFGLLAGMLWGLMMIIPEGD